MMGERDRAWCGELEDGGEGQETGNERGGEGATHPYAAAAGGTGALKLPDPRPPEYVGEGLAAG